MEKRNFFLKKAKNHCNISLTSLLSHLNGRTRATKKDPLIVFTSQEDDAIVMWILNMQKCGLLIIL
jgi:hypothetical protein